MNLHFGNLRVGVHPILIVRLYTVYNRKVFQSGCISVGFLSEGMSVRVSE